MFRSGLSHADAFSNAHSLVRVVAAVVAAAIALSMVLVWWLVMRLARLLRLAKMLRLARLKRILKRVDEDLPGVWTVTKLFGVILIIMYINHLIACIWYYFGTQDDPQPDGTTKEGWVLQLKWAVGPRKEQTRKTLMSYSSLIVAWFCFDSHGTRTPTTTRRRSGRSWVGTPPTSTRTTTG